MYYSADLRRMNFPPRAGAGCITQQHRVSTEPAQMAEPGLTLHVRQSCSHIPTSPAPRPGAQGGVPALPRGWSTPILRAHISADSHPHPNPSPHLHWDQYPAPGSSARISYSHLRWVLNILCLEECRGDGLWTSLDKPTEKNKTNPMARFISISLFFYILHRVYLGTQREGESGTTSFSISSGTLLGGSNEGF